MNTVTLRIAVIGGGAAGLMAAVATTEGGRNLSNTREISNIPTVSSISPSSEVVEVNPLQPSPTEILFFEKNSYLGAKVLISGGGRCNVTTGIFDVKKLIENYPRGGKFLLSAFYRFPPEKVMQWFENQEVPLKIEEDLRVFPVSDQGKDIVGALEKKLQDSGVQIFLNARVIEIQKKDKKFQIRLHSNDLQNNPIYEVDYIILTTGGNAYRHTGSTGDGYAFAQALGHTITPLAPSLNSFIVGEKWIANLAGVSFQKAELTFQGLQRIYRRVGPFLFTHHGITGPAVFALSSESAYEIYDKNNPLKLSINFFPEENPEALRKRVQDLIEKNGKKHLVNFLDLLLPQSLCPIFAEILQRDPSLTIGQLRKEDREYLLKLLQNFEMKIVGRGAGDEFVTAGGVPLNEVNTNTMESKVCPGLFFAGEILDIDGFTGGFNLQAAWATGRLAGEKIRESIDDLF